MLETEAFVSTNETPFTEPMSPLATTTPKIYTQGQYEFVHYRYWYTQQVSEDNQLEKMIANGFAIKDHNAPLIFTSDGLVIPAFGFVECTTTEPNEKLLVEQLHAAPSTKLIELLESMKHQSVELQSDPVPHLLRSVAFTNPSEAISKLSHKGGMREINAALNSRIKYKARDLRQLIQVFTSI